MVDECTFIQGGAGAVTRTCQDKIREIEVSVTDYGAQPTPADASAAFAAAFAYLASIGGGTLRVPHGSWILNGQTSINTDNVFVRGDGRDSTIITRQSGGGYMFQWAVNNDTNGGGIFDITLVGVNTAPSGAGLGFGNSTNYANKFVVHNVRCDSWGQYGCQVYNGNDWSISQVRVTNHGSVTGAISSCIGFGVYPRLASSGGMIDGVYTEIGAGCLANTSANTAAMKLQTHQRLMASNLYAVGGSEECVSIDSIDGTIRGLTVWPSSGDSGLAIGNFNPAHTFSGQTFVIDGVTILGAEVYGLSLSGDGAHPKLTGCTIRNITSPMGGARFLNGASFINCMFDNWTFGSIRFSHASAGTVAPTGITNDGNIVRNVVATGQFESGLCAIEVSNSVLIAVGTNTAQDATAGPTTIVGTNNIIKSPISMKSTSNGLVVTGADNIVYDPLITGSTSRSLFLAAGSDNNTVYGGDLSSGSGYLDSGSGNLIEMANRRLSGSSAPTTGPWKRGDIVFNTAPTAGGTVGWSCILGGTPGTWKTFGTISV